jgi:AcrR family transcriptional regulator
MTQSIMTEMTKNLLADSLKNLMKTKPLPKITVQELVNGCRLNRRTFYYHFKDIYDILEWIYKKEAVAELPIFCYVSINTTCRGHSGRDYEGR